MKPGDTITINGREYTAVYYSERPAEMLPTSDDPQCKICPLAPHICKIQDECHGAVPFVLVETRMAKAMNPKF